MKAVAADFLFDGAGLHRDRAVLFEPPRILDIVPRGAVPAGVPVRALPPGAWLAPGFVDLQVNGGGDVLFNDDPTPAAIKAIVAAHRRFGTTALLPTLISDSDEKMRQAFAAAAAALADEPGIVGLHCEGPFLNPQRAGVHDRGWLRRPQPGDLELLTSLQGGATMVTLAPECVTAGFVARLAAAGVRVALGHSMASYAETRRALAEGLTGFTHLFNAMPPMAAREPGPIAAALEAKGASYGLIVDGEHVAPPMLRLALRGAGRAMLVTDAMPPVGGRRRDFTLYGETVAVAGGRLARADGTLAGSALDMASAVRNCVRLLGLPLAQALRLAAAAPAEFLGRADLGRLARGCRADLVALDPETVQVLVVWVAGHEAA